MSPFAFIVSRSEFLFAFIVSRKRRFLRAEPLVLQATTPIRQSSKPSTAKCDLNTYTGYLIVEPKYSGCCRLAEMFSEMSHDSINRFLLRERYDPKDLFTEIKGAIELIGGTLSGDDTIIEKPYSDPDKTELISYYWSGKQKKTVKGINLITLYYTDGKGHSLPINYRLYNQADDKTKNDYLREMVEEVIEWGIQPLNITTDSWYSSRKNLKFFRNKRLGFLVGIAKNRLVKVEGGQYVRVENLEIPDEGKIVTLKQFGVVKVFKRTFKNGRTRYLIWFQLDESTLAEVTRQDLRELFSIHWGIETYHRALKQLGNIGKFLVRTTEAIGTHLFCSLRAFCQLELMRFQEKIESWYEPQRDLYLKVAREYIIEHFQQQLPQTA